MPVGTDTRDHLSLDPGGEEGISLLLGSTGMLRATEQTQDVPKQLSAVPMHKGMRRCNAQQEPAEIRFHINRGLIKRF